MTILQKVGAIAGGLSILALGAVAMTPDRIQQQQLKTGTEILDAAEVIDLEVQARTQHGVAESNCNPNYSGCLKKNAGDYDCVSGSGNGPNYTDQVRVLGYDEFDLDRDNDGWGCE